MKNLRISVLFLTFILSLTACSTATNQTTSLTPTQASTVTSSPTPTATPTTTPVPTPQPTATPLPTLSPSPTITPKANVTSTTSPIPTKKPTQSQLIATPPNEENATIKIISVSSPAPRNSTATLKAKVAPGATASIVVHYKSGASTAAGLEPKKADSNGNVSWSWHVGGNTTLGNWRITVSSGNSSEETTFEVVH